MEKGKRIRDYMEVPGLYRPGARNAITDVEGVRVGHCTMHDADIHTGITIIAPHERDPYKYPTPCAVAVGNGFGKLTGSMQVEELGLTESVIGLTGTFAVPQVVQGILNHQLSSMSGGDFSMNVLVGETNDSFLNNMRSFPIRPEHVEEAFKNLSTEVEEGAVGAGAGTVCYGRKGGIGSSSRIVPLGEQSYTLGALLQTNFGGHLNLYGTPVSTPLQPWEAKGSCMIVLATDAPLSSRQLKRLAKRGLVGMTMTGSYMGHGSGDFCIAFSNCPNNIYERHDSSVRQYLVLPDDMLDPLFDAATEAVRESVYNSLTAAEKITGYNGNSAPVFVPGER